jgi:hypothetical protein
VANLFSKSKAHLSPSKDRDEIKKNFLGEMDSLKETASYKKALQLFEDWSNLKQ